MRLKKVKMKLCRYESVCYANQPKNTVNLFKYQFI